MSKISQPWAVGRQANAIWCPVLTLSNSQLHTWEMVSPATVVGPPTERPPAPTLMTLSFMSSYRLQTESNSSWLPAKPTLRCFYTSSAAPAVRLNLTELFCDEVTDFIHRFPECLCLFLVFSKITDSASRNLYSKPSVLLLSVGGETVKLSSILNFFLHGCWMCNMVTQQRFCCCCCCMILMPKLNINC